MQSFRPAVVITTFTFMQSFRPPAVATSKLADLVRSSTTCVRMVAECSALARESLRWSSRSNKFALHCLMLPLQWEAVSESAKAMITEMLVHDEEHRSTAEALLKVSCSGSYRFVDYQHELACSTQFQHASHSCASSRHGREPSPGRTMCSMLALCVIHAGTGPQVSATQVMVPP